MRNDEDPDHPGCLGSLTIALLLVLSSNAMAQTTIGPGYQAQDGAVAVIIAGQSNAAGRGSLLPEDKTSAEPGVVVVHNDGRIVPGIEPFDSLPGTGYGRTLARTLIEAGIAPEVWIIQCAVGGTPITNWIGADVTHPFIPPIGLGGIEPKQLRVAAGSNLYLGCLAQAAIARHHGIQRFIAVAWHQGEYGCGSPVNSAAQFDRLQILTHQFKTDFPGIAFIGGELARWSGQCAYKSVVDDATLRASDAFVSSEGLESKGVHFTRSALREFGTRYAEAILSVINSQ